jgi:hypothetical protein
LIVDCCFWRSERMQEFVGERLLPKEARRWGEKGVPRLLSAKKE